jgi:hypothetical protein
MGIAKNEAELAGRLADYLKAEIAKEGHSYEELAKRMKKHGFQETKASVTNKLYRGTFPATFMVGVLAALEREGLRLADV